MPLVDLCRQTLEKGDATETRHGVRDSERDLLVRTQPYVAVSGVVAGVVVTLTDVTEISGYARRLEEAQELAMQNLNEVEELYRVTPQSKALLDASLCFTRVNQQFAEISGLSIKQHIGRSAIDVVPQLGARVFAAAREVSKTGSPVSAGEVIGRARGEQKVWEIDIYPVRRSKGDFAVGLNLRDVTKHKIMEVELRRLMMKVRHRVKNMLANVTALINRARREEGEPREIMGTLVRQHPGAGENA